MSALEATAAVGSGRRVVARDGAKATRATAKPNRRTRNTKTRGRRLIASSSSSAANEGEGNEKGTDGAREDGISTADAKSLGKALVDEVGGSSSLSSSASSSSSGMALDVVVVERLSKIFPAIDEKQADRAVKSLTNKAASETSSLLEDLTLEGRIDFDDDLDWDEYLKLRDTAMRRGVAELAVAGIALATITSTVSIDAVLESLESNPPLAAFEQVVGLFVTLYYGTVYRKLLTTLEGRQLLRINFAESFSQVSGAAEFAGRVAATNAKLDKAICKVIAGVEATPASDVPQSVRQAIQIYFKSRDAENVRQKQLKAMEEQAKIQAAREKEAKVRAAQIERERQQREREAKAKAAQAERERQQREREAKAEAAQEERERLVEAEVKRAEMEAKAQAEAKEAQQMAQKVDEVPSTIETFVGMDRDSWLKNIDVFMEKRKEQQASQMAETSAPPTIETFVGMDRDSWLKNIDAFMAKRSVEAMKESGRENEAQLRDAVSQLESVKAELDKQNMEISSLKQSVESERERAAALQDELEAVKLSAQPESAERISELEAQVEAANKRSAQLEVELGELQSSSEQAELEYAYQLANVDGKANERVIQLEKENTSFAEEVSKLQKRLKSEEIAKNEAYEQVDRLKQKIATLERSVAELKAANKALERNDMRADALEERVKALREENAGLNLRVSELTTMIRQVEREAEIAERDAAFEIRKIKVDTDRYRRELESQYKNETRRIRVMEADAREALAKAKKYEDELKTFWDSNEGRLAVEEAERAARAALADARNAQNEAAELNKKISELQSKMTQDASKKPEVTPQELSRLRSELESASKALSVAESNASKREKELKDEIERTLNDLNKQKQKMEADLAQKQEGNLREMAKLQETVDRLTNEKEALEKQLLGLQDDGKSELAALQENISELRNQLEKSASDLSVATAKAQESARTYASELESLKTANQSEIDAIKSAASAEALRFQKEIERLTNESLTIRETLSATEVRAKTEEKVFAEKAEELMKDASSKAAALERERDSAVSEIEQLRAQYDTLLNEKKQIETSFEKTKKAAQEASEQAQRGVDAARLAAKELETRLQAEIDRLMTEQSKMASELTLLQKQDDEITQLRVQLADASARAEQADARSKGLDDQVDALNEERDTISRALSEQQSRVSELEQRVAEETTRFEGLTEDVAKLLEEEAAKTLAQIEQRDNAELSQLRVQLADVSARAEQAEARARQLESDLSEAKRDARRGTEDVQKLEEALREAEVDAREIQEQLNSAREERETIGRELEQAKQDASEAMQLRALSDEMERKLADADDRAAQHSEELRKMKEDVAQQLENIMRERDELTAKLGSASSSAASHVQRLEEELREARQDLTLLEARLSAAEEDEVLAAAQAREEAAADAQNAAERAAQELSEAEYRFAKQIEELEGRLSAAQLAAAEAEAKAEALAKRASIAEDKARKAAKSPPVVAQAPAPVSITIDGKRNVIVFDPKALVALSKMKRAELIAECTARGLDATGVAAELRSRLRSARDAEKSAWLAKERASKQMAKKTPTGYYRTIGGVKYDNQALLLADGMMASKGEIDRAGAEKIYENVFDGAGVTDIELNTLALILAGGSGRYKYVLSEAAATYMEPRIEARRTENAAFNAGVRRKKAYRVVDGQKLDEKTLSLADGFMSDSGSIDLAAAERVYESVLDGAGVTAREISTLNFIIASNDYVLSDEAVDLLRRKIDDARR